MPTPRPNLLRTALRSFAAALLLGAIYLAYQGLIDSEVDCVGMGPRDCELERELDLRLGQQLLRAAAGLGLVSIGLLVFTRGKPAR